MKGTKYITFGEIMLRVSPWSSSERIIQTNNFRIEPGGSESNVAISLSNLGYDVKFVTALPDNLLKRSIIQYLKKYNIATENIIGSGKRLGIYWTENGISVRASKVLYDREGSSFSDSKYSDYNWKNIFVDGRWFHVSGITAALNSNMSDLLIKIIKKAKLEGLINSIDLNYRNNLWNWIKEKSEIYEIYNILCNDADLIIGNETDFQDCLGIGGAPGKEWEKHTDISGYEELAEEVFGRFNNLKYLAMSMRNSLSASENKWYGILIRKSGSGVKIFRSKEYIITDIVDRVGAGDSFSAGIIYGLNKYPDEYQKIIDFAAAFSCLKHTIRGDANEFFEEDVLHLIYSKGSGRIQR